MFLIHRESMPLAASHTCGKSGHTETSGRQGVDEAVAPHIGYLPAVAMVCLLLIFVFLQCLLPVRTALKIGADEGFELAKATLCLKGYKLYTEVWNDQPPLHTFLISQVMKDFPHSIFGPRLLTSAFTAILLAAVFLASHRLHGLLTAALATALLIASPGFLELSCSVMQEIPALAPSVAALAVLLVGRKTRWHVTEIIGGILFAVALQMKFIGVVYLPLAPLILCLRGGEAASMARPLPNPLPRERESVVPQSWDWVRSSSIFSRFFPAGFLRSLVVFVASLVLSFVAIILLIGEGSYLLQLKQSWTAHFASITSFEYGSPSDHPFDWSVLLKNWDTTIPAVFGIVLCFTQVRKFPLAIVPIVWLGLTLVVFGTHKPWWTYYYVHTAVPLCWCAAIGIAALWQRVRLRRSVGLGLLLGLFVLGAMVWMSARVYLQVTSIRQSRQIYGAYVLKEIDRLKPFAKFMYTDEPVYSFHAGIPLLPKLGVISLKRFWSGDLTNARLAEEMWSVKPGILLLKNTTQEQPFSDLINAEYRLVYYDADYRLYGHKAVMAQANNSRGEP